ncbi:hypothetical protein, partial [Patulibacter medicamentivorans]|uniref:hypothetical protein n=1 Tax=Patulibacter medicamentivorans TaxID=1097667 RepID=UPI00058B2A0C
AVAAAGRWQPRRWAFEGLGPAVASLGRGSGGVASADRGPREVASIDRAVRGRLTPPAADAAS